MESVVDLEALEQRSFAFYPPILNIEHNQWRLSKASWSEVLFVNAGNELEVWIPRRLLGEISSVDEPVMIVGLLRELEYKAGSVWPHERRVLEMPAVTADIAVMPAPAGPAPRVSYASRTESRAGRLILIAFAAAIAACLVVLLVSRVDLPRPVKFTSQDQDYLSLSRHDDYFAVVEKLGKPAEDRWRAQSGELQYRLLSYPQRGYSVVLLGADRNDAHYIGALDRDWRVIHYTDLAGRGNTASMLRALPRF